MFSQMTRMLDILQDYLGYRGFTYERLDGSVRGEERYLAIRNFNEMEDTFAFLLSTKAGGQGLNLTSADTVIFVDSDYNPQNDLQAAARAHRLGQTRPVKIIRLVARNTVEEIILKRADDKLKLTNTVIEGGQFSSVSQGLNQMAETNLQLADILKFGLDKLFDSDENAMTDKDIERILGKSSNGKWVIEDISTIQNNEEKSSETKASNMYVYEGRDYSRETSDRDKNAFDKMIADMLEEVTSSERTTRSVAKIIQPSVLDLPTRKRKPLTEEELEERRKKREENAAKRAKMKEEKEQMREEARKKRLQRLWKENNYSSLNIVLDEVDDENSDEELSDEEVERRGIEYLKGDVTQPINNTGNPAIIVHCVDDSGHWGKGGLFTAISRRSSSSVQSYELAGSMEDLHLGDSHLIPFDQDEQQKQQIFLSLIVAQTRDKHHRLLPMDLSALSQGLERVHKAAKQLNATVHLPRIGHTTPGFNWYGTERLIRKHLASRGISTSIYYYVNKQMTLKRTPDISSSDNSSDSDHESTSVSLSRRNTKYPRVASGLSDNSSDEGGTPSALHCRKSKQRITFGLSDNSSDEGENTLELLRRNSKQPRLASKISGDSSGENKDFWGPTRRKSKQLSNESKMSVRSLPDFFSGVRIYFKDVPEEKMNKLRRYVVAYNGDVETLLCDDVTHIICDIKSSSLDKLRSCKHGKVIIVTIKWLEDCVKKQQILDTKKYLLK